MIKTNFNPEDFLKLSIEHLANYIRNCHLSSAVLGISGGIDSTVVAYILYKVEEKLHNENYEFRFLGYSIPSGTTDEEELGTSKLIGAQLCKNFSVKCLSITSEELITNFTESTVEKIKLRKGNMKSRLRMMYLYDKAQENNGIVIGTDNYTEYLLGFSTIGGDGLFDYNPIQWLWKTEVYMLAKYILGTEIVLKNFKLCEALSKSIDLPPMDGLGISSSDMEQIGAKNYYDVDEILNAHEGLYLEVSRNEIVEKFGNDVVTAVINRYERSEFKRNHPVIPKLCTIKE